MAGRLSFKRNIGLFMAVMIGIGAMMGPGIFALPGELARMAGPLGVLVYLAIGLFTVFTALNYSELGAAIPIAGGGYSFVENENGVRGSCGSRRSLGSRRNHARKRMLQNS